MKKNQRIEVVPVGNGWIIQQVNASSNYVQNADEVLVATDADCLLDIVLKWTRGLYEERGKK